jgi:hypothetical protein
MRADCISKQPRKTEASIEITLLISRFDDLRIHQSNGWSWLLFGFFSTTQAHKDNPLVFVYLRGSQTNALGMGIEGVFEIMDQFSDSLIYNQDRFTFFTQRIRILCIEDNFSNSHLFGVRGDNAVKLRLAFPAKYPMIDLIGVVALDRIRIS